MIATFGDYPHLLRMLGLVVDLRIEARAIGPPEAGTVKAEPGLILAMASVTASPRTHYTLDDTHFLAAPRAIDPEIRNGLLRANDTSLFQVTQVDVVGAGVKLQNVATNMMAVADKKNRAPNIPDNSGLPALRTGGIALVRRDLKTELHEIFARASALQAMLCRLMARRHPRQAPGRRQVRPMSFLPRILCAAIALTSSTPNLRHGTRSAAAMAHTISSRRQGPRAARFRLMLKMKVSFNLAPRCRSPRHQSRPCEPRTRCSFGTDGVYARRGPGRTIMPHDQADGTTTVDDPKNEAATKFKLEINFTPKPGSLPRLRFGYDYRLRARICDVAGNSVFGPDDPAFAADWPEQTSQFRSARFEPISPPAMMLRAAPIEGESVERMVVRTPGDCR
jgi:hypothetical protein